MRRHQHFMCFRDLL